MGRQIITEKDIFYNKPNNPKKLKGFDSNNNKNKDDYFNRLLKYIPAEIVALYLTLSNIISSQNEIKDWIPWFIFIVCLIFTPLYLYKVLKVNKIAQIAISILSFVIWAYALGGPFETIGLFDSVVAAIILPIFTVFISIIKPEN